MSSSNSEDKIGGQQIDEAAWQEENLAKMKAELARLQGIIARQRAGAEAIASNLLIKKEEQESDGGEPISDGRHQDIGGRDRVIVKSESGEPNGDRRHQDFGGCDRVVVKSEPGEPEGNCRFCDKTHIVNSFGRMKRCPCRCPCNVVGSEDHSKNECTRACELPVCISVADLRDESVHRAIECQVQCCICGSKSHPALDCHQKCCPCGEYGHWVHGCTVKCQSPGCQLVKSQCQKHCSVCGQPGRRGKSGHPWRHPWGEYYDQFECDRCHTKYWSGYACQCANTGPLISPEKDAELRKKKGSVTMHVRNL